jgi:hypothetical protein
MHRSIFLAAWISLSCVPSGAADDATDADGKPSTDKLLAELASDDIDVRNSALHTLQTSLDPRIADAMLPLLSDDGDSIRRLAARAIGSRWWQVPKAGVPKFLNPLKAMSEHAKREAEKNMADRAIGLLTREYQGKMFSRSANKRWVVYERFGLPCLIDTKSGSEELLGWSPNDRAWISAALQNRHLANSVLWNEKNDLVALSMILSRKTATVWIWKHGAKIRKFKPAEIVKELGFREDEVFLPAGFSAGFKKWEKDELLIDISYNTKIAGFIAHHEAELGWDPSKDRLRVISRVDHKPH